MSDALNWLKQHVGIVLISILLVLFSPIISDILPNDTVSAWSKVALIVGNVLLAALT